MKENLRISEFLKTGKFGLVQIGDSMAKVISKLGETDGKMSVTKPLVGIHYGFYELIFDESGLRSIQNDNFNPAYPENMEFSNEKIQIDSEFLKSDKIKKLNKIEAELKELNLKYSIVDYFERKALKMESGVLLDFNNEKWDYNNNSSFQIKNFKDFELIGIRYFPDK